MSELKNRQAKIKYLDGYYWILQSIKLTNEKLERLESQLYSIRASKVTDMPRGGKSQDIIDKIYDKEKVKEELERRLERADERKKEIEGVISKLGNERYILLLQLNYIDGLSLTEVAYQMNLSYSRIIKLHAEALDKLILPIKNRMAHGDL